MLIWKLKLGDKDALRQVYEKYKDNLRTIACSLLNDPYAAEDVLHDVFVSFAERVKRINIKVSLKHYLTTCVVNRVRDEFRSKQSRMVVADKGRLISPNSNRPDRAAIINESSRMLTKALAEIPLGQREVILLHLKDGMKFREIAKVQKTSLSTVHGRYRYGLEKLRGILDGETLR